MKKERLIYLIITIIFIISCIIILHYTNLKNNVELSKAIEIIIILFLIRISYGCTLYIRKLYRLKKYSYTIVMNLGLSVFLNINILRHISLLIENWKIINIMDIYNNTLESFSFFALLTLPCIIVLSIYGIITNIILIKKERFTYRNLLAIGLCVLAIIGLFGTQGLYILSSKLSLTEYQIINKKCIDIILNATLSYFYSLIIATLYCNIRAAKHQPDYDKDFVIILGSKIKSDGTLTPLLKGRVDRAIEFANKEYQENKKRIYYVPSGGQGKDEVMAEAIAIKNYLIEQGVDDKYILVEDKSTSTIENMKFSKEIINKKKKLSKIIFSTTNYHVFRSGVIANDCGIDCEGIGSSTKWYFYINALIREFIANIYHERKKHLSMMVIINISTIILIVIGYYYDLIKI